MPRETLAEMSIKAMKCSPKEAIKQEKTVFMARVFGEVADVKTKERRDGSVYTVLLGDFVGVKADNTEYESEKLILPGGIQESVLAAVKAAEGKPIQFGYDISSTVDEGSTVGYKYAAKTIIKTEAHDRLAKMSEGLQAMPMPGAPIAEKATTAKK